MSSKKPIKIMFVIDAMACGGTELQLLGLIQRLDRNRFQPVLCTIRPSDKKFEPTDCERLALDVPRLISAGGILAILRMAKWLRKNDVHIVQTFFQDATVFGGVSAWFAQTPCRIASFRDMAFWDSGPEARLTKLAYSLMTRFAANAQAVKDHFVARFGVAENKVTVIPNGVDVGGFSWHEHVGETTDIVIVGNLNRRVKRTDLFIRAAGKVAVNFPEVRWHVVGDGKYGDEYTDLAKNCGIAEKLEFVGKLDDVTAYLTQMQVAVLCSDSEGFSNAILEYMLMGCAVIATNVGGNPEAVIPNRTGILVEPDNVELLAKALESLIANTELRQQLARSAREFVEENFDWVQCVVSHERFYESCVGPR